MKISDNTSEVLSPETGADASAWRASHYPIAPWWHTALLVAFLITISVITGRGAKTKGFGGEHVRRYLFGMGWECVLAAIAWWGIRMNHVPVRQLLGQRRPGWRMWARDLGAAITFWLMAVTALTALAAVLKLLHLVTLQKAAMELAPQSALEFLLWFGLCITAGMVEEFVFRGYLLQQFASIGGRIWLGVVVSSLLFGASHGYEGIGGMIAITAYGAMFSMLAVKRKSLRAGMMAHAWHDIVSGIALAIVKHLHLV